MFAVYCRIFSKSTLICVSGVHTKHHGCQPPGKMPNVENCQKIVRLVMMVMNYSASVLVNVSAVARGGAEGNRALPVFFPRKVKTDLYKMLKIKYYLSRGLKQ